MRRSTAPLRALFIGMGGALLAGALVFGLLPGPAPECGSLLVPTFSHALDCAPSQVVHVPEIALAGVLGLVLVLVAVLLTPYRPQRRRNPTAHPPNASAELQQ